VNQLVNNYDCTIDAKNRLMIPVEFRREVDKAGGSSRWYVVLFVKNRLLLMPEDNFERWSAALPHSPMPSDEEIEFERALYRRLQRVEPDKQGRIVIPDWLLKKAGLGREVTLGGQRDKLEVYDRGNLREEGAKDDFDEKFEKARAAAEKAAKT